MITQDMINAQSKVQQMKIELALFSKERKNYHQETMKKLDDLEKEFFPKKVIPPAPPKKECTFLKMLKVMTQKVSDLFKRIKLFTLKLFKCKIR